MARGVKKAKAVLTPEEKLTQALVPVEEQPYPVPGNWCWVKWGSVGEFVAGNGFKNEYQGFTEYDIPFYKVGSLKNSDANGFIYDNSNTVNEEIRLKLKATIIPPYSILFAKIGEAIKLNRRSINEIACCIDNNMMAFIPNCLMRYAFYFSCGVDLYEYTNATTVPAIRKSDLEMIPFPLAPLAEQQRIVDRIESLFAKLDEAKEKAQAVVDGFEDRKAAILHKAFTGELVHFWRDRHNVSSQCKSVTVDAVCRSLKYGTAKKSVLEGTVVVIRMGNLQQGEIDWTNLAYSDDEEDNEKYRLMAGDVLFNRTNSPELVGKTSIYRGEFPAIYAGYLIKLDYDHSIIEGEYLNYMLNSPDAREYCKEVKTDGVNQSNINAKKIGAFGFRLPSISEQQEIVRHVRSMLSNENQAFQSAEHALTQIDTMKKAILARAFRGELGTNDPTDESAAELLKRIL